MAAVARLVTEHPNIVKEDEKLTIDVLDFYQSARSLLCSVSS